MENSALPGWQSVILGCPSCDKVSKTLHSLKGTSKSLAELAKRAGLDRDTVSDHVKKLEQGGVVRIEEGKGKKKMIVIKARAELNAPAWNAAHGWGTAKEKGTKPRKGDFALAKAIIHHLYLNVKQSLQQPVLKYEIRKRHLAEYMDQATAAIRPFREILDPLLTDTATTRACSSEDQFLLWCEEIEALLHAR